MADSTDCVGSVMKTPVWAIRPDLCALDALQFAAEHGIHHLPVLEAGEALGLVCTCDLEALDLRAPVTRAISRPPVTLREDASVSSAAELMGRAGVGSLLVMRSGLVVGIVTRGDLVAHGIPGEEPSGFRCFCCGALEHLHEDTNDRVLCADCAARSLPAQPGDETGNGD